MLLTIMAIIGKNQELPRERWKLYDHAASVLLQHWDINRHLDNRSVDADFVDEDDKRKMLRRLAFKMQGGKAGLAGNYIHRDQLLEEFETYFIERYNTRPDRAKIIALTMIQQFHERNFILSLYGANLYGFVHRAFLEFFCATAFTYSFERTHEITIDKLKSSAFDKHWKDQSWHEVLRLISGMLVGEFAGEIIDYLLNDLYKSWPEPQLIGNRPPWNIALAVQCLSEVRNINLVERPSGKLLRKIVTLFDYDMVPPQLFLFFKKHIIPHVKVIGTSWPNRTFLSILLKDRKPLNYAYIYDRLFGTFIGLVGGGDKEIKNVIIEYSEHADERFRVTVPFALAIGWKNDPNTKNLLKQLAEDA